MTALTQLTFGTEARGAKPFRVENVRFAGDLRFGDKTKAQTAPQARTAPQAPPASQSGTKPQALWDEPLLRAPFVTQILGQVLRPAMDQAARRAASRAYGAPPIRPAVLVNARA